jgi:hypothetical protein
MVTVIALTGTANAPAQSTHPAMPAVVLIPNNPHLLRGACAWVASGHAAAAPPSSVMNARRFNATATVETKASSKAASRDLRLFAPQTVPLLPIYPDR